ncbi:MAG: sigma-54 dependent transcriptional regulator [candidate division KSB1 bacterium]|nr:sigma-54 dependent transcriptional regulator [candidate division KSB1 bacterium]MDZ7313561.1 sigma-54 dependent transcriptional regulator [candidate division KSB1 bacterium]
MPTEKILIVDDDPELRQLLGDRLAASGYRVLFAENGREGVERVREENPDLVLLDLQMPEMDGMEALAHIRQINAELPVIMLTAFGTLERAVEAMKRGAYDFLPKPCEPDHLLLVIRKALERKNLLVENLYLKGEIEERYRLIVGEGSKMRQVLETAQRVAATDATVLIEGESGTGKQVLAHAIHAMSERRHKPFIQVNCTTLSEQLLESDLFGHEKGAFTGAHQMKKGRVELADGGTLFLDEIGDLSPIIQAKFLRFLEQGEFERVGGMKTMRVDARVITATNKHLEKEVQDGRFRGDLFYRLNVVSLLIPPLRERPEDIPVLANHFLERFNRTMRKRVNTISPTAMEMMLRYHWPGNVRELENAIERAVVLATGAEITPELLPAQLAEKPQEEITVGMPLDEAMLKFKKQFIAKTLESTGGNQSKAAELLGIQRTYLSRLVKDLKAMPGG